jgi:O-antigen ligase
MNKEKTGSALLDWGLILFACSLPWSNFGMSISYFLMLGSLVLLPRQKKNARSLKDISPAVSLIGTFLIFLIPVIYTQNLKEAIHDLNIKLPALLAGLIFLFQKETIPKLKNYERYLSLFSISCLLAVGFSFFYFFYLDKNGIHDSRQASLFISHIRLSLMAALAVLIFLFQIQPEKKKSLLYLLPSAFMFLAIVYLGWINGILAITLVILVLAGFSFFPVSKKKILILSMMLVALVSFASIEFNRLNKLFAIGPLPNSLPKETVNKNQYYHDTLLTFSENGNRYGLYYQPEEFRKAWEKRSNLKTTQKDAKGNQVQYTCFRYLTSKGLGKDSLGVWQLSPEDIRNIELGIPNYQLPALMPFERRVYDYFVEWQSEGSIQSVNGHSLGMRTIYWKSGLQLIKENFLWGLGTGSVPDALKEYHQKKNKQLAEQFRNRSHNQYITTFLNSGIIGITLFLAFLLIPLLASQPLNPLTVGSWLVLMFSMLSEDTLETQAGVGLFIWIMMIPALFQATVKHLRTIEDKNPLPYSN